MAAITAHAPNKYKDHARGMVMAAPGECVIAVAGPDISKKGASAIATSAQNQTANRVPEFRRPISRSISHANRAIAVPSARQFNSLSTDICATKCMFRTSIVLSAILVEHLPQAGEFVGVNALLFQDVQHQQFPRVLKKSA